MTTVRNLIAAHDAARPAISAPAQTTLSYGALLELIDGCAAKLRAFGIGPSDRVAIVLPNGPAAATAFLAVASASVAAPLNPNYKHDEFAFYMDDLSAKLLITADAGGQAALAAKSLDIAVAVIELSADAPAGAFKLSLPKCDSPAPTAEAASDTPCLVLHTSGTTSRPKIVPLTHRNVTSSAANIAEALALTSEDRCMNIMPLFHIHGLIAAVLASLKAGSEIYCTPGFNALKVFGWFEDANPTWYTAVPTMHQAILGRAGRNTEVMAKMRLRFIRSSSSSLPPQVMAELEQTFECPVVEAYGMTEAAHQMTSNPLVKGGQRPGSVGKPAGPDVAILTEAGVVTQQAEQLGEIIISGGNVTLGYEANEKANAENFFDNGSAPMPWFKTGDQGKFDEEGYLYITGRLKEIINRGGEKISPREVDEVLMDHPAVNQAVCFALPHKSLGEDVAAAIVLNESATATDKELREFASMRLAAFKVPRTVLIVDEIPKGATGKLQRIGLHKKLGLAE